MRFHVVVLAAVSSQFVGCASIVNGHNQSISVEAKTDAGALSGANCKLTNNKGTWFVTTPGSATVHRSYEDLAVRCEKEAMEPGLVSAKSNTKGMAFGNIIFGGLIGAGVDISTGAAYDYPALITVVMGKTGTVGAPSPAAAASAPGSGAATAAAPAAAASAPADAASAPVSPAEPAASAVAK